MEIVKLSSKGQIVIPAWLRRELGLSEGDKLLIERRQEEVVLKPVVKLSKLRGIDKIEGASDEVERIRKEWDVEFENLDVSVIKFRNADK
jgi:AbrB family looped-hinge helix DNA binding protein